MKKRIISSALALGMTVSVMMSYEIEKVSAVIQYLDGYTSNGELFISASDVVEFIKEDRTYLSFANVTGMGEILSLKERPESDEKLLELMYAENRNIHYCYIESEDCILWYNNGEFKKTDYDISIKYIFDLVNKKVVSKVTGEEVCTISDSWEYTVYQDRYISTMIYMGDGVFISPVSENRYPGFSSSTFSCSSRDIVKVIRDNEEALYFADQTGLGRILVLPQKPATEEEMLAAMQAPKLNIHFCYLEKEKLMMYYDYSEKAFFQTDDRMEVKYTIDLLQRNMVDNGTNEVVLSFAESPGYWVINEKNEKKEMILAGDNFVSLVGYSGIENNTINVGDINADGKTDLTDLSELSLALVGDKELTEAQQKAADVDGDGAVKLADLAKFRQYLSKVISSLG